MYTITYQEGLESVAESLKGKGYTVVPYNYAKSYDCLIYSESKSSNLYMNISNGSEYNPSKVLLINVYKKSIDEIINMIKTKSYSPIF